MPKITRSTQPAKALSPMVKTVDGITMALRFVQPAKAFSAIIVTLVGMVLITFREVQLKNAFLPMDLTVLEMLIFSSASAYANAFSAMV